MIGCMVDEMGVYKKVDGMSIKLFGAVLERVKGFILGFCVVGLRIRSIDEMDVVDLELSMSMVEIWVDWKELDSYRGL